MSRVWKPTAAGKLFTTTPNWVLTLDGDQYAFTATGPTERGNVLSLDGLVAEPGAFWATVRMPASNGRSPVVLDGIPNDDAADLVRSFRTAIDSVTQKMRAAQFLAVLDPVLCSVAKWSTDVRNSCKAELEARGWLGREFVTRLEATRPNGDRELLNLPEVKDRLAQQSDEVQAAARLWRRGIPDFAESVNQRHLAKELQQSRAFSTRSRSHP